MMLRSEIAALSLAGLCYLAAWILALVRLAAAQPAAIRRVRAVVVAGLGAHSAAVGIRWIASGHPPLFGTFETALADAWVVVALTLAMQTGWEELCEIQLVSLPVALVLLAHGLSFSQKHFPLTISERSLWIDLHAAAAWVAFACYGLAFAVALLLLLGRARPAEVLDEHMFRFTIWGFVAHSVAMASGAYYGFLLFGEWWRWDPVESLALVAWLGYGLIIHLRLFFGWRDRRAAWATLTAMAVLAVSYKAIPHLPAGTSYHVFDLLL